ncbi:murein hydrolase activator EnvC family protein [Kozakia baliensis]|nr:peptidoglycan DD-metalloendopeptidase family protein [Kozakia baliensis]GEL63213.1 peptidase M23 [Kozakia baliensis]
MRLRFLWPLAVLLAGGAQAASTRHGHRRADPPKSSAHRALNEAQQAHAALMRQQAAQAALIKQRQQAQKAAQARARVDAVRTQRFSAQTAAETAQLQATQAKIDALQANIDALTQHQSEIRAEMAQNAAALRPLLPLAERMSLYPGAALIAAPAQPRQAVQGLAIMAGFSTLAERSAEKLDRQEAELAANQKDLNAHQEQLDALRATQKAQRDASAHQTKIAAAVQTKAESAAERAHAAVAAATAQAADLQDAIARIEQAEASAQARLDAEARELQRRHEVARANHVRAQAAALARAAGPGPSQGHGGAPVAGSVAVSWGQSTEAGPASGMTYTTAGGASVHAPCAGRVDFAGDFRSFGQMLILDCGRRYRFVLSGLGNLAAQSGQSIGKGATLGAMPASGGRLFVQLRAGSRSVDPRPFL